MACPGGRAGGRGYGRPGPVPPRSGSGGFRYPDTSRPHGVRSRSASPQRKGGGHTMRAGIAPARKGLERSSCRDSAAPSSARHPQRPWRPRARRLVPIMALGPWQVSGSASPDGGVRKAGHGGCTGGISDPSIEGPDVDGPHRRADDRPAGAVVGSKVLVGRSGSPSIAFRRAFGQHPFTEQSGLKIDLMADCPSGPARIHMHFTSRAPIDC